MTLRSLSLAAALLAAPLFNAPLAAAASAAPLPTSDTQAGASVHQAQMMWDDDDDNDVYDRRRRWRDRDDWRRGRSGQFDCNQYRCIDQRTGDLWYSACGPRGCWPTRFARPAGRW